jgi:hypothetical protein
MMMKTGLVLLFLPLMVSGKCGRDFSLQAFVFTNVVFLLKKGRDD